MPFEPKNAFNSDGQLDASILQSIAEAASQASNFVPAGGYYIQCPQGIMSAPASQTTTTALTVPEILGPTTLTTNTNNWTPPTQVGTGIPCYLINPSPYPSVTLNFTGITAPTLTTSGTTKIIILVNSSTGTYPTNYNLWIPSESSSSTAANRISFPNGLDGIYLYPGETLTLAYDPSSLNRWRMVAKNGIPPTQKSVTTSNGYLQLVNDTTSLTQGYYYGTNDGSNRGWYQPGGGPWAYPGGADLSYWKLPGHYSSSGLASYNVGQAVSSPLVNYTMPNNKMITIPYISGGTFINDNTFQNVYIKVISGTGTIRLAMYLNYQGGLPTAINYSPLLAWDSGDISVSASGYYSGMCAATTNRNLLQYANLCFFSIFAQSSGASFVLAGMNSSSMYTIGGVGTICDPSTQVVGWQQSRTYGAFPSSLAFLDTSYFITADATTVMPCISVKH
jgi:hypothetical protein